MQKNDISKYEYVSFDVFDTLIFRSVATPEDIFIIVQELYIKKTGCTISSFYRDRIKAERIARSQHIGQDITLDEIYFQLKYKADTLKLLKEIEIYVELENCIPNAPMVEFVNYCRGIGKKIVITTDMYLPRSFFEQLFNKLGIKADFLFISSEERETKRSGKLFQILLKKLNVPAAQVLHIGDDDNNDIYQAMNNGIDSLERWYDWNALQNVVTSSYIENHIDSLSCLYNRIEFDQSAYNIGFSILGPLIYDFCNWLHEERLKQNIDKLLFVAREGYLLEKCYKCLYPEEADVGYIFLNKNLLRLPLTYEQKTLTIYKDSLLQRSVYSWNQIYDTFLIAKDETQRRLISDRLKISISSTITREDLYNGIYDDKLNQLIELCTGTMSKQSCFLMNYLVQNGIFDGKIGLVNNSINGNGQLMLESYLHNKGIDANIYGLQFHDSIKCKTNVGNRYSAYFDSIKISSYQKSEFDRNCLIFEHLLFEPSGTSLHFFEENGTVVVAKNKQTRETLNYPYVDEVQKYTLLFINAYKNHIPLTCSGLGINRLLNFFHYPQVDNAEPICQLWDEDADGSNKIADSKIALKWNYKIFKNVPKSIIWIEGYLSLKGVKPFWLKLIQLKLKLLYYKTHKKEFVIDLLLKLF